MNPIYATSQKEEALSRLIGALRQKEEALSRLVGALREASEAIDHSITLEQVAFFHTFHRAFESEIEFLETIQKQWQEERHAKGAHENRPAILYGDDSPQEKEPVFPIAEAIEKNIFQIVQETPAQQITGNQTAEEITAQARKAAQQISGDGIHPIEGNT